MIAEALAARPMQILALSSGDHQLDIVADHYHGIFDAQMHIQQLVDVFGQPCSRTIVRGPCPRSRSAGAGPARCRLSREKPLRRPE